MDALAIIFRLVWAIATCAVGISMAEKGEWVAFAICLMCLVLMGLEMQLRRIADKMK